MLTDVLERKTICTQHVHRLASVKVRIRGSHGPAEGITPADLHSGRFPADDLTDVTFTR